MYFFLYFSSENKNFICISIFHILRDEQKLFLFPSRESSTEFARTCYIAGTEPNHGIGTFTPPQHSNTFRLIHMLSSSSWSLFPFPFPFPPPSSNQPNSPTNMFNSKKKNPPSHKHILKRLNPIHPSTSTHILPLSPSPKHMQ